MCSDLWAQDKAVMLKVGPFSRCQVLKEQSENLIRHTQTLL